MRYNDVRSAVWMSCLLAIGGVVAGTAAGAQDGPPRGRGGFGGLSFSGGVQPETKLVKQFDRNGDGWLNLEERRAALEYLNQGQQGSGGRGFGGFFGMSYPEGKPGESLTPADVRKYGKESMYDPSVIRTFFFQFDSPDWEKELMAFHKSDVEVPAIVTVDGQKYTDVGVHFRGASSFAMVPAGLKHSLNVSFNFLKKDQQLGGYSSFDLLNVNGDPTFLRTVLYEHIARQYVAVPRTNFVRVAINGENWGLYINQQRFTKDFLQEHYKSTEGTRWKVPGGPMARAGLEYLGDSAAPYRKLYDIKSKDTPEAWAAMINFTRILNQTPAEQLEKALKPVLDVDETLRFLAIENVLVNEDGYFARASDYNIYLDGKGVFHIIPHDFNEAFPKVSEGSGRGGPPGGGPPAGGPPGGGAPRGMGGPPGGGRGGFPSEPDVKLDPLGQVNNSARPLLSKLLAVPAFKAKYLSYVRDIAENQLDWAKLGPVASKYHAMIAADVRKDTRKLTKTEGFDSALVDLKKFADERRAFLLADEQVSKAARR